MKQFLTLFLHEKGNFNTLKMDMPLNLHPFSTLFEEQHFVLIIFLENPFELEI